MEEIQSKIKKNKQLSELISYNIKFPLLKIPPSNYKGKLGAGTFGTVKEYSYLSIGVAMKEMNLYNEQAFKAELSITHWFRDHCSLC